MRLSLPPRLEQLRASARAIHLTLPVGAPLRVWARWRFASGRASARLTPAKTAQGTSEHRSAKTQLTDKEEQIERLSRRLRDALSKANRWVSICAKKQSYADSRRGSAPRVRLSGTQSGSATEAEVRGEVDQLEAFKTSSRTHLRLNARRSD